MSSVPPSVVETVRTISPGLAEVLWQLHSCTEHRTPQPLHFGDLLEHIPADCGAQGHVLLGALAVLRTMGVVDVTIDSVKAVSEGSSFFLASLSKFLRESVPAISYARDTSTAYRDLTKIYESARIYGEHSDVVGQEPLACRHVVNVVIKSRMKRDWQYRDAYLHVYHPDWREYHLIGLGSDPDPQRSIDEDIRIAERALQKYLDLEPGQYALSAPRLGRDLACDRISETTGALAHYTFMPLALSSLQGRLRGDQHLREDRGPFRWFTRDEIDNGRSYYDEPIMWSTPYVMRAFQTEASRVAAVRAEEGRQRPSILRELGSRFSWRHVLLALSIVFLAFLPQFLPWFVSRAAHPDPALENLANVAQIISSAVTLCGVAGTILAAWVTGTDR